MNNKRVWKIISLIGIILMTAVIIGRVSVVNARYPQRIEKEITRGDFFEWMKGVEMCVIDSRWLSAADLQREYSEVWYVDNPNAYQAVEVKIKLKNKYDKRKKIPLFRIYIESDRYDWNGSDADLFIAKNNASLEMPLEPGEEKEYIMPYTFLKDNYKESEWATLSEEGYFLVTERYPEKIKWRLEFKGP